MPKQGLSKEKVVEAAAALIEQSGTADFSMRALADRLNIKTSSLYNHVENMDALMVAVCAYALQMQRDAEMHAVQGKSDTDAILALANAYRAFASEHKELYRLIMNTAVSCGEQFSEISMCIVEPFMTVLEYTTLTTHEKYHWQRILRGIIHGFVSQEDAGFFSHLLADADESFHMAIQCYMDGLAKAEKRHTQ